MLVAMIADRGCAERLGEQTITTFDQHDHLIPDPVTGLMMKMRPVCVCLLRCLWDG